MLGFVFLMRSVRKIQSRSNLTFQVGPTAKAHVFCHEKLRVSLKTDISIVATERTPSNFTFIVVSVHSMSWCRALEHAVYWVLGLRFFFSIFRAVEAYTASAAFYLQSHPLGPQRRHETFAGDPFHMIQEGGGTTSTEQTVCLRKATYFQRNTTSVQGN